MSVSAIEHWISIWKAVLNSLWVTISCILFIIELNESWKFWKSSNIVSTIKWTAIGSEIKSERLERNVELGKWSRHTICLLISSTCCIFFGLRLNKILHWCLYLKWSDKRRKYLTENLFCFAYLNCHHFYIDFLDTWD